ncbi:unnamed protein product, partial [Didymodactylos carnosus]
MDNKVNTNNLNPNAAQFSSVDQHETAINYLDAEYQNTIEYAAGYIRPTYSGYYFDVDPSSELIYPHRPSYAVQGYQQIPNVSDQSSSDIITTNATSPTNVEMYHSGQATDDDQSTSQQYTPDQTRLMLRQQLDYYFSRENMANDYYLQSQMDPVDKYVPISIIAGFKLIKKITEDTQLVTDILKELPSVEVDADEQKVRPARKRCIIILREIPVDVKDPAEVSELFDNERCPTKCLDCEKVGETDCWYVTFASEDDAQHAFVYLTRENVSIRGQKVLARMKARMWQKTSSQSTTNASTPISPPPSHPSDGITPPIQQPQTQPTFQHQQQPQQSQIPPSHVTQISSYPSHSLHLHSHQQQPHDITSTYMPNAQSSIISPIPIPNFRPQHPAQQQQPLPSQHSPGNYPQFHQHCSPNMAAAMPHLRIYHPLSQNQQAQQSLAFPQQSNISPYPTSIHQPTSFHPMFSPYMWSVSPPQTYANDPYTMKAIRPSRQDALSINNDHSSDICDCSHHDTHHSSGSGSPVGPRAEVVVNRNADPTASPVSNSSLQQVTAFPATANLTNEHNIAEKMMDQSDSFHSNDDTHCNNSNQARSSTLNTPLYQEHDKIETSYQNSNHNNSSFYPNTRTVDLKSNDTEQPPQQAKESSVSSSQQNVVEQVQISTPSG